jgi:hypothetical protein
MSFNRFSSTIVSLALLASGSVVMNIMTMFSPVVPQAQAQAAGQSVNTLRGCFVNSPFTARIAFNPTNIRTQPTTASQAHSQPFRQVGQTISLSGMTTGSTVADAWDGKPDNMWYRLADGRGFVASAVVKGYPARGNCQQSPIVNSANTPYLPFGNGVTLRVTQGYDTEFSHGPGIFKNSKYAVDFSR